MREDAWGCMKVHGDAWKCMEMHGDAWECMGMHGDAGTQGSTPGRPPFHAVEQGRGQKRGGGGGKGGQGWGEREWDRTGACTCKNGQLRGRHTFPERLTPENTFVVTSPPTDRRAPLALTKSTPVGLKYDT